MLVWKDAYNNYHGSLAFGYLQTSLAEKTRLVVDIENVPLKQCKNIISNSSENVVDGF